LRQFAAVNPISVASRASSSADEATVLDLKFDNLQVPNLLDGVK